MRVGLVTGKHLTDKAPPMRLRCRCGETLAVLSNGTSIVRTGGTQHEYVCPACGRPTTVQLREDG